ncbi:MAG: hypothetical protein HY879_11615 [Deltaproteobacteria bacterium]|nr:hypothetical protein [Deltaproteobacteria bacterium]
MKVLSCKKIKKLTGGYFQSLLSPDLVQGVDRHLAACPVCKKEYQETQEVLDLLNRDRLPDPGPDFWKGLNSRIMAQVGLSRPHSLKVPWYKKIGSNPFTWPGYAWVTALILILLTPWAIYTIPFKGQPSTLVQEFPENELKWELGFESVPAAVDSLSARESVRLGERIVARMGKDLTGKPPLSTEDELQWDVSPSLEGLNNEQLDTLFKKMKTGGFPGFKEEEKHVS